MSSAKEFFTEEQQEDIKMAIKHAELDTSGEIRVHIEQNCSGDVMDRAAFVFGKLGMHKTEQRNGVLFYLALQNRRFAILGDAGINNKVPENFWDDIKAKMLHHFRQNDFVEGLCEGIREAGAQLKSHFPFQLNDRNELSDDISFDNQ
jgi:uncharacterized membrane protein